MRQVLLVLWEQLGLKARQVLLNAYKLLEVSANFGWAPRLASGPGEWAQGSAFVIGLQLPLLDYFQALSEGGSSSESATTSSK